MTRIWTEEMRDYLDEISGATIHHKIEPRAVSESMAASQYFLTKYPEMLHEGKGFLVVDIGGGSTDAALWQMCGGKLTMVWQDSVQVAGQKMCTQWVESYIEEFNHAIQHYSSSSDVKTQFSDLVNSLPSKSDTPRREIRSTLVDRLLTFYSDDMLLSFKSACGDSGNNWAMGLYERIAQGTSLMMFCLGFQVGALYASGRFQFTEDPGYFTIAFGGRGSGMLDWLEILEWKAYNRQESERTLVRFFSSGMDAGQAAVSAFRYSDNEEPDGSDTYLRGEDMRVRVIRNTKDPKCEVARGLLVNGGAADDSKDSVRTPGLPGRYYEGAASAFRNVFKSIFAQSENASASTSQIVNIPEIDMNKLASLAVKAIPSYGADTSDAFAVLMKVIYSYLEGELKSSRPTRRRKDENCACAKKAPVAGNRGEDA